jgi:GntR family transcriptional regulator
MTHLPFQRLQADLADLIANSPMGARLPSEPELARQLGVSRATLREAMRTFEAQGLIRRRQGAGTFTVSQEPIVENGLETLESPDTIAQRMGLKIIAGPVTISRVPADEEHAAILGIALRRPLMRVSRILRSETRPVAYLVDTLSEDILRPEELSNNFTASVFDFLIQRGDPITASCDEVLVANANAEVAGALEIQQGDGLLLLRGKLYTNAARVIDYSFSYFLPGYFNFHIVRRIGRT